MKLLNLKDRDLDPFSKKKGLNLWKKITGWNNFKTWINFHGPFAVLLHNFTKNEEGISLFEAYGITTSSKLVEVFNSLPYETYQIHRKKQIELRKDPRFGIHFPKQGIME